MRLTDKTCQVLITAAVVLSIAWGVNELIVYLSLPVSALSAPRGAVYAQYLIAAVAGVLAVVLIWSSITQSGVQLLSLHLAALSLGHSTMIDASGPGNILHRIVYVIAGSTAVVAFVRFTCHFPRTLTGGEVTRAREELPLSPIAWSKCRAPDDAAAGWIAKAWRKLQASTVTRPGLVWVSGIFFAGLQYTMIAEFGTKYSLVAFNLSSPAARGIWIILILYFMTAILLGVSNLRVNYFYAESQERRKLLWLAQGYIFTIFLFSFLSVLLVLATVAGSPVLYVVARSVAFITYPLVFLSVLLCYVIAVFATGAFNPSLVVRKTTVYGTMLVVMTCIFTGIESIVTNHLTTRFGLPESIGTWLGGGTVALAFGPVRTWFERVSLRIFAAGDQGEKGPE